MHAYDLAGSPGFMEDSGPPVGAQLATGALATSEN